MTFEGLSHSFAPGKSISTIPITRVTLAPELWAPRNSAPLSLVFLFYITHGSVNVSTQLNLVVMLSFPPQGYQGMVDGGSNIVEANWESVSSILQVVRAVLVRLGSLSSLWSETFPACVPGALKTGECAAWHHGKNTFLIFHIIFFLKKALHTEELFLQEQGVFDG